MYVKLIDNPRRSSRRERIAGLLRYITNPGSEIKGEKCTHAEALNLYGTTSKSWIMQQLELAERSRSPDPFWHIVISHRDATDRQTVDDHRKLVHALMTELGMQDHQAVWALHQDTTHPHIHLVLNRVDPVTEKIVEVNHGWHIKALKRALHAVSKKLGYRIDPAMPRYDARGTRFNPPARKALSQPAQRFERYHGSASAERMARDKLAPLVRKARNWQELHDSLASCKARLVRKGGGLVLYLGEDCVKASVMGRDCSRAALERRLGSFEDAAQLEEQPGDSRPSHALWKAEEARKKSEREAWYAHRQAAYKRHLAERLEAIRAWVKREKAAIHQLAREHKRDDLLLLILMLESHAAYQRARAREEARLWKQEQTLPATLRHRSWKTYDRLRHQHMNGLHGREIWSGALPLRRDGTADTVLAQYRPCLSRDNRGVFYRRQDGSMAFLDKGQQILAAKTVTDQDILAMLRLAGERYPRGFEAQGSDDWKARVCRIARQHGISFEGRATKAAQLKQAIQAGKPPYMTLEDWQALSGDWQAVEKDKRAEEVERKRDMPAEAYERWLAERRFEEVFHYRYIKLCQRAARYPDDPAIKAALEEADRRKEAIESGQLTYEGWKKDSIEQLRNRTPRPVSPERAGPSF